MLTLAFLARDTLDLLRVCSTGRVVEVLLNWHILV
jgi:hypothetical protein